MKYLVRTLTAAAALLVPALSLAQSKPVDLYVSVLDQKGAPVQGLTEKNFTVREDGNAREVLKATPATEPMTVSLLIDDSQASSRSIMMIREAAKNFVDGLAGKAEIGIVTFGERPTIVQDYTTDTRRLEDAVAHIFPRNGSGSYLLEALENVSRGLQKRGAARPVIAVLMVEDVEFSNFDYTRVVDDIRKSRATLHVVSLGTPSSSSEELRNRNQTIDIATRETGGRRDNVLAMTALPGEMSQLAGELAHQYLVTYSRPERLVPADKLDVRVDTPGATVRARTKIAPDTGK